MNRELVVKIILSALMSVLTFAFVWGVYIGALLISFHSSGDASYALALVIAMTVQLIAYRTSPRRLRRLHDLHQRSQLQKPTVELRAQGRLHARR